MNIRQLYAFNWLSIQKSYTFAYQLAYSSFKNVLQIIAHRSLNFTWKNMCAKEQLNMTTIEKQMGNQKPRP